jgi:hypothetical protein
MIAIILLAGYNAILAVFIGTLMTIYDDPSGMRMWSILGGCLLFVLGVLFAIGIIGFRTSRMWGRKLLFWCMVVSLPLYAIAIFPIFQNEQMTIGNTMLQAVCILTSLGVLKRLWRQQIKVVVANGDRIPIDNEALDEEEEDPAFTFDRNARENDPFP